MSQIQYNVIHMHMCRFQSLLPSITYAHTQTREPGEEAIQSLILHSSSSLNYIVAAYLHEITFKQLYIMGIKTHYV